MFTAVCYGLLGVAYYTALLGHWLTDSVSHPCNHMVSFPYCQIYVPHCQFLFTVYFILVDQRALNTKVEEEMPYSFTRVITGAN